MFRNTHPFQHNDPRAWAKEEYGIDLSDNDIKGLEDYLRAVQEDMPVRYFETKFNRPVYINEFETAVVPDDTPQEIVNALRRQGLQVATYKAGDNFDRMKVVREQASEETRFSVENGEEVKKNDFRSIDKRDKEELARANERYNADLDAFARGESMSAVHLGVPSPALRASGLNGTEMYITRPTLRTHFKKHNLTIDDIRDLPNALENPLLVYEWGSKARSLIVITEIPHGDDRITVAVKLERNGKIVEVNEIASVHAKEVNRFFSDMAKTSGEEEIRSKFKWVGNKEEALKWLGLDSPKESGPQPPNELTVAKVIENFENPKIPEENNSVAERRRRAGERAVEALKKRGVDVVVDADEMQRVLDDVQGKKGERPQYYFCQDYERGSGRKQIGEERRTGEKRYIDFTRPDSEKVRRAFEAAWREYRSQHPDIKIVGWGEGEYSFSNYPVIKFPNGSEVRIRISDHTKGMTEEKLDNYEGNGISWCPIYSYRERKPHSVKGVEAYIDITHNRMGAEDLIQFIDKMAEYDRNGFPEGLLELADAGEKEMLQKTGTRVPALYFEDPRMLQSFGMDIAPLEGIKERKLRSVNYHFNEELSRFDNYVRHHRDKGNEAIANGLFADKPAKEHIFQLGMPSDALLSAGVQDLPLELSASTLIEKSSVEYKKNHPFEIESIRNLPTALAHPIAVFNSLRDGKRTKVILVELKEGDNNFRE